MVVLITTNEPLRRMHPAVLRPGRTWAEVDFTQMSVGEANSWMKDRGHSASVESATSVAELFAITDGRSLPPRARLGFAA